MRRFSYNQAMAVTALVVFGLIGCASGIGQPAAALANTHWKLVEMNGKPVGQGITITLDFSDQQASGSGGCNGYGGEYALNGSQITFINLASTLRACADTGVMEAESAYLAALQEGGTFQMSGGSLAITSASGTTLKFAAK